MLLENEYFQLEIKIHELKKKIGNFQRTKFRINVQAFESKRESLQKLLLWSSTFERKNNNVRLYFLKKM